MKLKVLATGVGVAMLAAPAAWADSSNVVIYGWLNPDFSIQKTSGATAPGSTVSTLSPAPSGVNLSSRTAVNANVSLLGFKGSEDLGGGLKAVWQIEQGMLLDSGGTYQRNSKVGLAGNWGEIFYGFWNTPMKQITYGSGLVIDPFGAAETSSNESIMGSPGFNLGNSAWGSTGTGWGTGPINANFDLYGANSVNYYTPNMNGLSAQFQYSANEGKGALAPDGVSTKDPDMWSMGVLYENGPFALHAAYERHNDQFGLTAIGAGNTASESRDTAWRIGGGYKFGNTIINISYEELDYENTGTVAGVTGYDRHAWQIGVSHSFGPHTVRARYNNAEDGDCSVAGGGACSTSGLGADMFALGYQYDLSKRTSLQAYWARIDNDHSGQYAFSFGSPIARAAAVGATSTAVGLGIRHGF